MPLDSNSGESAPWPQPQQNTPHEVPVQHAPEQPTTPPPAPRPQYGVAPRPQPEAPRIVVVHRPSPAPRAAAGQQNAAPQPEGLLGFNAQSEETRKSHPILKTLSWMTLGVTLLSVPADFALAHGEHVDKVLTKVFGTQTGPTASAEKTPAPVTTSAPVATPSKGHSPTTIPTPTKKSTTAPVKKVLPATSLACAQALPADLKIGQLIEPAIDANSKMAEVKSVSLKYHIGSWLVLKYPVQSDGKTPNVDSILGLKSVDKDLPTLITIDGEGGQINRLPGAAVPPGPDTLSATKLAPNVFEQKLVIYDEEHKSAGIDINLAPVADIQGASTEKTSGRLFRTPADAAKYMPSYVAAAKATGINLTFKHFPQVLEYGNTDLRPVSTPSYDVLLKNGSLDSYKLVKGTNNWVMMGSAKTQGFPNTKLDNGQIAVFNPAAYDAARQLAGDPLFITDALNAKAVNAVTDQATAAARAISAGADMAMIVPREGFTTTDTKAAIAAVEKGVSPARIDAAFLKVLGSKSVNACTLLLAKDSSYATPKAVMAPSTPTAVTTAAASPTIKNMPAIPGVKPTATTVPATKTTVHAATEMKATVSPTGKK